MHCAITCEKVSIKHPARQWKRDTGLERIPISTALSKRGVQVACARCQCRSLGGRTRRRSVRWKDRVPRGRYSRLSAYQQARLYNSIKRAQILLATEACIWIMSML